MKGIEQAKWPPSPGGKVECPENSREISKKTSIGNSKGATGLFEAQHIKSNVFCPFAAMTSHKWKQIDLKIDHI